MTETPPRGAEPQPQTAPGTGAERQTTPFLVLQFFIFPMAIVAVCVAVFVIFGLIAGEGKGPREYLAEVRAGGASRRWQAAFELSKLLQARKDPALSDPRFISEVISLFEEAAGDDPRVRRYLALALGRLGSPQAVPALLKALQEGGSTADAEMRLFAVWALGAIGDPSAVTELVRLSGDEDRGIRKTAVHALGAFVSEEAGEALARALGDAVDDVRWNAAVALARRGDARAAPVLLQMMDRAYLAMVQVQTGGKRPEGLTPEQKEEALMEAARAAATLADPELRKALASLRDTDPNLRVREAARRALEGGSGGSPRP